MTSRKRIFIHPHSLGRNLAEMKNKKGTRDISKIYKQTTETHSLGKNLVPSPSFGAQTDYINVEVSTQEGQRSSPINSITSTEIEEEAKVETGGSPSPKSKKRSPNFKPRDPNKCKKLTHLKDGEKVELTFGRDLLVKTTIL